MNHWYEKPLRVFDLALEDPYGQCLDRWTAAEVIGVCKQINANVLDMMIVNEWGQAYFNAEHLPVHPDMTGSDRLAEVLEEATKNHIRVLGMWGPTPNPIVYERHPDWAKRKADGDVEGWGYPHLDPCIYVCHNSPYGDIVLETLEELFAGYPIDGVAFDYFVQQPCYCQFCRDKVAGECGIDITTPDKLSNEELGKLKIWSARDGNDFLDRAVAVAHKHGRIIVGSPEITGGACDVIFAEPHTGGMITIRDKGFEIRQTTAAARVAGKPTVICSPYAHLYYVGLSKPPPHMRQEFREIVISDASPWPVIWDWELIRDKRGLAALGQVFKEVKDHEEYLVERTSIRHAALLVSTRTTSILDDEAYRHVDPAKGWYDALTRAHIPVDVILDEELNPDCLSTYRVLILANALYLDDRQVEAIKTFVSNGGGLVAGHKTSLYDGDGHFRREFALKDVFGCEYLAVMDDAWTYIGFPEQHEIAESFDADFLVMHGEMKSLEAHLDPNISELKLKGISRDVRCQLKVRQGNGAQVVATIFDSAKPLGSYFMKDLAPAMPGSDTGYPAIITNTYGNGRVVYFAGQVDRIFYRIGHPDHERLMLNSLSFAGGTPVVTVDAPTTVEATYYQQPNLKRIVIHFLNHTYDQLFPTPTTGDYGRFSRDVFRPVGDIIPVNDIRVAVKLSVGAVAKRIFSAMSDEDLPRQSNDAGIGFSISRLGEYEVVVVEYD